MKRQIFAIVAAVLLMSTPSWGLQGSKPKAPQPPKSPHLTVSKPVKPTTTTKVKPVSVHSTAAKPKAPKAPKATTTAVKPVKSETKAVKPAKTTKTAKAETKKSTTTTATNTPTSTTDSGAGTTTKLTPVQQKLQKNTNLASKLESRLPDGTNLMKAAEGFKNLGQFVAAVNVSHNHDYDFTKLKTLMVDDGLSLGQAMQKLKADANTTDLAKRAETDANRLIASTDPSGNTIVSTAPTTTTTTTAKKKPAGGQQ
jgi:hypothetical protein